MAATFNNSPPRISPKLAHGKIRYLFHPLAELLSFNLIGVADLAYDRKSTKVQMTVTTAPQSADGLPPEQHSHTKKDKIPSMAILRHTVHLGVIGAAETAIYGVQKGVLAG